MNTLRLEGCRVEPMAGYLKALGVLRIVAEQEDAGAHGFWDGEVFCLETGLDGHGLAAFFCERYAPTPVVAPWNGDSGFYDGNTMDGIDAIARSSDPRLAPYREVIEAIRGWSEMPPAFRSVGQVVSALDDAIARMKEGKARSTLARLRREILDACPAEVAAGGEEPLALSLDEIDRRAKLGESGPRARYGRWMKTVKKGRTAAKDLARKAFKPQALPLCRARLPDGFVSWLDTACALGATGEVGFNPLLGSGGNEGRLDFSNNFMQRIRDALLSPDRGRAETLCVAALQGTNVDALVRAAVGQYDPGHAGGANQGHGVAEDRVVVNPWDFVLAIEGALLLASSMARRARVGAAGSLSCPFTVRTSPVGYATSQPGERARAETWLPVWRRPTSLAELRQLFCEARSQVGRRPASTGLDFARAAGTLGVDRGVDAFARYVYLERRGKNFVALPAGRVTVRLRPDVRLLDELDPIRERVDRFLRQFGSPPASMERAARLVEEATFACALQPDTFRFQALLRTLGRLDALVAARDRDREPKLHRPLLGLSPRWIGRADDGSVEIRLAAALQAVRGAGGVGPLRANMSPVDPKRPWTWATGKGQRAWVGSDVVERLGGALARRMRDAGREGGRELPLRARLALHSSDAMALVLGATDDRALEDLLWGCGLVDWRRPGREALARRWTRPVMDLPLSRAWAALKLLFVPGGVGGEALRPEPRIVGLLQAGRSREALEVAVRRLRTAGLAPLVAPHAAREPPARLLAGLLVPVRDVARLERAVLSERIRTGA